MISVTILIPFPVSFSICSSITSLWFLSCLILLFWWPSLKSSLKSICFSLKSLLFLVFDCLISKLLNFSQKYKIATKYKSLVDDRRYHPPSLKLLIKHKHDYSTKSEILFFWWPSLKSSLKSFVFILHDCFSFKSFSFFFFDYIISKLLDFPQKYKLKDDFPTNSESSVDDRRHHLPSSELLITELSHKHEHDYSTKSEDLVDDGWVEVLCRLPLKNIIRCKLVSKSWNRLIPDLCIPKFRPPSLYGLYFHTSYKSKRRQRPPNFGREICSWDFLCIDETDQSSNLFSPLSCFSNLPFLFFPTELLHCSNGFLLINDILSHLLYVCNPLTKQLVCLPKLPEESNPYSASLMFDPHLCVVCILCQPLRMIIHSSITHEWTEHRGLHFEEPILLAGWSRHHVLLDGCLYCLSRSGHLLEFDVKRASSRAFQLPEVTQQKFGFKNPLGCVGLSNGNLQYGWKDQDMNEINVWTLQDSKWLPKHAITLLPLTTMFNGCDMLSPIAFHPSSDIIFLGHDKGIFGYHPDNKKLECLYKAKSRTSIDSTHISTYPFSWNVDALPAEPVTKNQAVLRNVEKRS